MAFLKKHFSTIILAIFLLVIFVNPNGYGTKIRSKLTQLISFSPSIIEEKDRIKIKSYDWLLISDSNKNIDFNELKGEIVIVNFWATWCPPCIAEMPSIQKLYDDYSNKIKFLIVTKDNPKKVSKFMEEHEYTFPIYFNQSNELKEFNVSTIPATFLISKNGEIVIDKRGAADWNSNKTRKIIDSLL